MASVWCIPLRCSSQFNCCCTITEFCSSARKSENDLDNGEYKGDMCTVALKSCTWLLHMWWTIVCKIVSLSSSSPLLLEELLVMFSLLLAKSLLWLLSSILVDCRHRWQHQTNIWTIQWNKLSPHWALECYIWLNCSSYRLLTAITRVGWWHNITWIFSRLSFEMLSLNVQLLKVFKSQFSLYHSPRFVIIHDCTGSMKGDPQHWNYSMIQWLNVRICMLESQIEQHSCHSCLCITCCLFCFLPLCE